ncbi:MAG: 50S ribosomal protein L11 methyltransferase [Firmicutes bacterium]|nr:50S ribosomal protein L11 methyltransferase [Alicyclobacillaceae bacterium]MCL6496944.1 50S ribosomal protein L11 methyltransferase [Bacillota bacterium]
MGAEDQGTTWWRVVLEGPAEAVEAMAASLFAVGATGVEFEDGQPVAPPFADVVPPPGSPYAAAYFPQDTAFDRRWAALKATAEAHGWQIGRQAWASAAWEEAWKAHYHPVAIGDGYGIVPAWYSVSPYAPARTVWIDPGMAFGTGTHPTTLLCLRALLREGTRGRRVLDLGSGSGILALFAARLGAQAVDAVEPDPLAVKALRGNIARNGLQDRIRVVAGELKDLEPSWRYGVIAANLVTDLLLNLWPALAGRLDGEGAYAVLSGVTEARLDEVEAVIETTGHRVLDYRLWQGWAALVVRPR